MRKTRYFFLLPALLIVSLCSCEKSYTCTCTYQDGQAKQSISYKLDHTKHNDAVTDCDNKAFLLKDKTEVSCGLQ